MLSRVNHFILIFAICFAFNPLVSLAEQSETDAGNEEEVKKDAEWSVSSDTHYTDSVDIDTTETTWSNVSVSPDGKTLIFDMLGDIYSVAIGGGEATALTAGIEWNYQPTFSPDGSKIAFVSDRFCCHRG